MLSINVKLWRMPRSKESFRLEVADRLHSAAIHLLRHARKQDVLAREAPARLSALSVLVFGGPMALGQLAAAEQVKAPTMSRIVAGLKRSGLAMIESDAQDARRIRVIATPKGERLLQQARKRRIRLLAETLEGLREPDLDTLFKAAALMERAVGQAAGRK
jgi:DNA-binding MarR family transcriptional regulator